MLINKTLLERLYHTVKAFIPEKILYDKKYFEVREALNLMDANKLGSEFFDNLLKEHLIYCINHVPFYSESVNTSGLDLSTCTAHDLLSRFPYITKELVQQDPERFISNIFDKSKLLYGTSGGSTGVGIGVWYNKEFSDIERAFFDHEWGKLGFNFRTSRILRFGSDALKKEDESPCVITGRKLSCSAYHFNDKWLPEIVDQASRFSPECIHGYPSLVYEYLNYLNQNELSLPKSLKFCLLASEPVLPHQLELIKKFFNNNFSINYGLTERNIIGFSELRNGELVYRLNRTYGYFENFKSGTSDFELVGTSYWNKVMPLVRYRTKDYGEIDSFGIVQKLLGREQEFLLTKEKTKIPGMAVAIDKFLWDYVTDVQLYQNEIGKVIFKLVPKTEDDVDSVIERFKASQYEKWGCYFDIEVELVDSVIMTSSGKKKLVICEVN